MKYDFLNYLSRAELWILGSALVAFLVGIWVLRGAPPGQTGESEGDDDAPGAGYRDRIVVAVVVGLILILGGAYAALSRGILLSLPIFAVGFGLVLALISFNRRFRHSSPSLRRTIDFSSAFLNASLLAGTLIVVNVIAFRYGGQPLDLTREQTYSPALSMTINQLVSLKQPVTFTLIFGRGIRAVKLRDRVVQLLESYKAVNPQMIQLDNFNPYSDPARGDELAKRVPELEILHERASSLSMARAKRWQYRGAQPGPVPGHSARSGARRPKPIRVGIYGRRRDYIGFNSPERREEVEGCLYHGAR